MAKLTLTDIANLDGNPSSAQTTINNNWALIETALENTLSRDGTVPNTMSADLDMNSNHIYNLPTPTEDHEPATLAMLAPILELEDELAAAVVAAEASSSSAAASASTAAAQAALAEGYAEDAA